MKSAAKMPPPAGAAATKKSRRRKSQGAEGHALSAEELIDESLEESFPASDPPSWTTITGIGGPRS